MNKYDKAAMMIGKYGTGAEADAIVKYLEYLSAAVESNQSDLDKEIYDNVKERISDEINHLLGDTLDAMRIADLRMSSDDINKIFAGFMELVDWGDGEEPTAVEVEFTNPEKVDDKWKVEAEVKPATMKPKSDLINL